MNATDQPRGSRRRQRRSPGHARQGRRRPIGRTFGLCLAIAALASSSNDLHAQAPDGWGRLCDSEEARRFDFMIGTWNGVEYRIRGGDTTAIGRREYTIEPVHDGCGLLERVQVWEGDEQTLRAVLLRSLDRRTSEWVLTRLDDGPTQRRYESTLVDGVVYFGSSYPESDTVVYLRLAWQPRGAGFRQTIHESRGDARSWRLVEYIDFVRRSDQ